MIYNLYNMYDFRTFGICFCVAYLIHIEFFAGITLFTHSLVLLPQVTRGQHWMAEKTDADKSLCGLYELNKLFCYNFGMSLKEMFVPG